MRPFILGPSSFLGNSALIDTPALFNLFGKNIGNSAFRYAIHQQLGGNIIAVRAHAPIEKIQSAGDIGIIPCSNQLGPHDDYSWYAKIISNLKIKVVAIGLGAQAVVVDEIPAVPQGTLDWVREISERSAAGPNISLRGSFSFRVLEHYKLADKAQVLGCPSLFINPDAALGKKIAENLKEPRRIAVASGHPKWNHLSRIEASLADMVTATSGSYIAQSPLEMVTLCRGEVDSLTMSQLVECRDSICPHMDIDEFKIWTRKYGNIFFSVPAWMEHYRKFDFVVGTRIHGVMLALQAGIPALCIAHDSRILELCETMLVPYVNAKDVQSGLTREMLLKLFKFDPDVFDKNREELAKKYESFLISNNLNPIPLLDIPTLPIGAHLAN